MAILNRVSERALWLRRISSMPVSTCPGAEVPGKPRTHHGVVLQCPRAIGRLCSER